MLALQVESLLSVLCEETDIAEVELKMGGFKMRVRRSLNGAAAAPAAAASAPVAAPAPAPAPAPAAAPAFAAAPAAVETTDEDESLLDVTANKVGRPPLCCQIVSAVAFISGQSLLTAVKLWASILCWALPPLVAGFFSGGFLRPCNSFNSSVLLRPRLRSASCAAAAT